MIAIVLVTLRTATKNIDILPENVATIVHPLHSQETAKSMGLRSLKREITTRKAKRDVIMSTVTITL